MAKSKLTLAIENALKTYKPAQAGGIKINIVRGKTTAFEVPVANGTTDAGLIDCVRINEYFGEMKRENVCICHSWVKEGIRRVKLSCKRGLLDSDKAPMFCDEKTCRLNAIREIGVPKILITCYEIKVSVADFKSKNGHNFVGNLNYYVVPSTILKQIRPLVPKGIGIISYCMGSLRRQQDSTYREMEDEDQKWMLLSVMKRLRR